MEDWKRNCYICIIIIEYIEYYTNLIKIKNKNNKNKNKNKN